MSSDSGTPGGGAPPDPPRKTDRRWLGEGLRALLKGYAEEPLPNEFTSLLDKLESDSKNNKRAERDEGTGNSESEIDRSDDEGGMPSA